MKRASERISKTNKMMLATVYYAQSNMFENQLGLRRACNLNASRFDPHCPQKADSVFDGIAMSRACSPFHFPNQRRCPR